MELIKFLKLRLKFWFSHRIQYCYISNKGLITIDDDRKEVSFAFGPANFNGEDRWGNYGIDEISHRGRKFIREVPGHK